MDEFKFKSDRECEECKKQHRKAIIQEVKEACGKCNKLRKVDRPSNNSQ